MTNLLKTNCINKKKKKFFYHTNYILLKWIVIKLYKICPKVLTSLWKLLRITHIKKFIAQDWGLAGGIYVPKEKNSKNLEQFRPI